MNGPIIGGMASRVSSPVLIGRLAELAVLQAAAGRARSAQSSAILLAGEAGVGKTRLVTELAEQARAQGGHVLMGGCIELGDGALPYAPVVEALRGFVRRSSAGEVELLAGDGRAELARLLPDLGPMASEPASGLSVGSAQGRLFELLLGGLERLAARSPVLFIIEDLHWSDQSTRDLLGFLVRNLRDAAVMLLLTYRSDELHRRHPLLPFLAELQRTGRVERIELQPFDSRDTSAQLRAIAGHDLDPALLDSIHTRSGGNAFFVEELLVAAGEDGRAELPATLRDVLLARVTRLSEPTQEFLRVASAAGQRVDPAILAVAAALDEGMLYDALRESVARQVLVPDDTRGTERYAFRHALLQEAVYDDLLPGERTRLHAAFARTLEAGGAADGMHAAEIAYHWYAAHDLPRALRSAVVAGQAAEARYAFPEATVQYERAIELWDQVDDAPALAGRDRVDLLAALAGVARFHEPARSVTHIRSAIRLVDEGLDPVRAGLLHERLGRYAWIAGQGELAQAAYETAMRLIPSAPPSEARARALAGLAQIVMLAGRFADSGAVANDALAVSRAVGARDVEGHALNTRAMDRGIDGDLEPALEDLETALAIAEQEGIVDDIGRAYANRVWLLDAVGRLEEAVDLATIGVATSERLGSMRFFGSHMLCNAADALYRLGRWDECELCLRRADEVDPQGVNHILLEELLARLAVARGRFEEAGERLRPLAPLADRAIDIQFIVPVQGSLAELALWQGQAEGAAARVAAAIRQIDFSPEVRIGELYALGVRANADAAELARIRRTPDLEQQARAAGAELLAAFRRRHRDVLETRPVFAALSEGWLLLCEAEGLRLQRRPEPEAWAASVEAWARLDRPYVVAYARWREAEALAARARLSLAADSSDAVVQAGDETDEAARLGLTAREREVLALVALGRTNRQIADELFISSNTAGVHVSNIMGKLGVSGRGEAAAVAYRLGLVDVDTSSGVG
jgi:DNA-binding CsgD family transcriptional regulator